MEERPTNHILLRSFLACVLSVLAFCITVLFFVAVGVLGVLISTYSNGSNSIIFRAVAGGELLEFFSGSVHLQDTFLHLTRKI